MYRIESKLDTRSESYISNKKEFLKILDEYRSKLEAVKSRDQEKPVDRHKERGKLLARERIDLLIAPNTPFLEFSPLVRRFEPVIARTDRPDFFATTLLQQRLPE